VSWRERLTRVARFLARILTDLDVTGLENIPRQGPVIIYFNHVNFLDVLLACAVIPREVVPLSKAENFRHPILGLIARAYGAIPVRRGEADTSAIRRALAVLQEGKALLIAPEGTRSGHGRLLPAKDGLTYLAVRTRSTLIPVALLGQRAFFRRLQQLRKTRVCVWVGRPFRFMVREGSRLKRHEIRHMTVEVMRELAALLPPASRGIYAEGVEQPRQWISYERQAADGS
jgi:1-acyl-sn-glycerol-3-phosphate acyltransferase